MNATSFSIAHVHSAEFTRRLLLAGMLFACVAGHPAIAATKAPEPVYSATRPAGKTVRIVLVGDSTVAPTSGWGDGFITILKPEVDCINIAKGGRSSKSYTKEGWWKKVLATKPDYVLIQFGHNDQPGKGPERETDPNTTFPENMGRFVDEARAIGAKPVLITSLTRRGFDSQGKINSNLTPYADATKKVAAEKKVPMIDLHAISIEALNKLGPEGSKDWNPPGKDKTPAADHTHLTPLASEIVGKMVAAELKKVVPELAPYLP